MKWLFSLGCHLCEQNFHITKGEIYLIWMSSDFTITCRLQKILTREGYEVKNPWCFQNPDVRNCGLYYRHPAKGWTNTALFCD